MDCTRLHYENIKVEYQEQCARADSSARLFMAFAFPCAAASVYLPTDEIVLSASLL